MLAILRANAAQRGSDCDESVIFVTTYFTADGHGAARQGLEQIWIWRDHVAQVTGRRALSDSEPIIIFRPPAAGGSSGPATPGTQGREPHCSTTITAFNRQELAEILNLYGRKVAAGEWRDYALDLGRERAVFSVFRRASEVPIYRIEKCPKLARRQGAYAVVAASGLILKRGHDLKRVLSVLDKSLRLVEA